MIRQLLTLLTILWLTATLTFFGLRLLPSDAISAQLIDSGASPNTVESRRSELGLNGPILIQYMHWITATLQGDLGVSLIDGQPVNKIIANQLPATINLASVSFLIATFTGIILGCWAGFDASLPKFILNIALGTPIYWTGTIAIWLFAVIHNWLPSSSIMNGSNLVLPATILGFHTAGAIGRMISTSVTETRSADFITTAYSRGLSSYLITWRHILRPSLLPAVTIIALQTGFLLSGTVIVETLFVRPGIGRILLDAVLRQDYPVVQGIALWTATSYTLVNATANVIYRLIDPRVSA